MVQPRGMSRPQAAAFSLGGAGLSGQGRLRGRTAARAEVAAEGSQALHTLREAPGYQAKVRVVHSQAQGIYTQRGGGWGVPSTSHVQGLPPPPPAPSSYFGSCEESASGPCWSCDRDTVHSEGRTQLL